MSPANQTRVKTNIVTQRSPTQIATNACGGGRSTNAQTDRDYEFVTTKKMRSFR